MSLYWKTIHSSQGPQRAWPSDEESALTGVIMVPSKKVVLENKMSPDNSQ